MRAAPRPGAGGPPCADALAVDAAAAGAARIVRVARRVVRRRWVVALPGRGVARALQLARAQRRADDRGAGDADASAASVVARAGVVVGVARRAVGRLRVAAQPGAGVAFPGDVAGVEGLANDRVPADARAILADVLSRAGVVIVARPTVGVRPVRLAAAVVAELARV